MQYIKTQITINFSASADNVEKETAMVKESLVKLINAASPDELKKIADAVEKDPSKIQLALKWL